MTTQTTPGDNLSRLRLAASNAGIDLLSCALLGPGEREGFHESIRDIASSLRFAVVIGLPLSEHVLSTIEGRPNWTYYHHYRTVNFALDQATLSIAAECRRMGAGAFPLPASQILDWERLRAHANHRELGALAGLGWRGRNNLLVNRRFGSQVRYASVLTDLPLPARGETPDDAGCGDCGACVAVCPSKAIADDPRDFDLDRCTAQVRRFSASEKLNALICGVCVRACGGRASGRGASGGTVR